MADFPTSDFFDTALPWVFAATVPIYWNDTEIMEDDELWEETTSVYCIFQSPYLRLELGTAGIDAENPVATFQTADVPGARGGDEITIGGITYEVGTPMPDDAGMTVVDLIRQAA
jgi:hypothetical protein